MVFQLNKKIKMGRRKGKYPKLSFKSIPNPSCLMEVLNVRYFENTNNTNIKMKIELVCAILFLNLIFLLLEKGLLVQKYIVKQKPRDAEVNPIKIELYGLIKKPSKAML